MKKRLCLLILCLPLVIIAQDPVSTGIRWSAGLSWEQVKQKAKKENKYIFIDAYTTWCGPCKAMDKYVYPNDTVGRFFNEKFICVKAQMDVTDKDVQSIKVWYDDAITIRTEYIVEAYPCFIFLSPEGEILQKEQGYRSVDKFIAIAMDALKPGRTYYDPYNGYNRLVAEYKQGVKRYDSMPGMIKTAVKINDADLAREMFKDHLSYASSLNEDDRYTKENISLWYSFLLKLDSKALQFFLEDHIMIDQVMGQTGFSDLAVDKNIQGRIVDSFFRMQKGQTTTITGKNVPNSEIMFMKLPERRDGKINPDYVEADWKKLKKMIREHFSEEHAIRNVYKAKARWYNQHQNKISYVRTCFDKLNKYPPVVLANEYWPINQLCWETFLYVNDKKLLQKALEWMDRILENGTNNSDFMDTYANLLYKIGQINEAIEWEEKALQVSSNDSTFSKTLKEMKKGECTYLDQGAIWPNKD